MKKTQHCPGNAVVASGLGSTCDGGLLDELLLDICLWHTNTQDDMREEFGAQLVKNEWADCRNLVELRVLSPKFWPFLSSYQIF